MKIGILETGLPPEELDGAFGSYPDMFAELLAGHNLTFEAWAVLDGKVPDTPDQADGWLITGSKYGVYEDHPWIAPLYAFVRDVYASGRPLVGICFGHQLMADALGGKAEKYDGGWGVGAQTYQTNGGESLTFNAFHQDQVTQKPPQAEIIAASDFCRYAGLRYRKNTVSLQPHPEFDESYMTKLVELRGDILPPDVAKAATAVPDSLAARVWAIRLMVDAFKAGRA